MLNKSRPWSISTLGVQSVECYSEGWRHDRRERKGQGHRAQRTHQEGLWLAAPANSPWCSFEVFFILTWYMEKFVLHITKEMTMAKNRTHNPHIKKKKRLLRFSSLQKTIQKRIKGKPNLGLAVTYPPKDPNFHSWGRSSTPLITEIY